MAQSKEAVLALLSPADREALTSVLKQYQDDGVSNPKIPLDYDVDGDGKTDAWALDTFGQLTLVTVESVDDTVYVSDGTGVEQGGNGEGDES
jgi:hypothetical protein